MPGWRNHPIVRAAGWVAGLGLTGAALWFALGHDWRHALTPLLHANPKWLAALALAVVGQLLLTGLLFWVVTLSFDAQPPVGPVKMIQIIAASSLLSYLPMEAGFLGRTAYLKLRHGLPVLQSVLILLIVIALSIIVPGVAVLLALSGPAGMSPGAGGSLRLVLAVIALIFLSALTGPVARSVLRRRLIAPWSWVPIRSAELLVGALRLWVAFQIIGSPVGFVPALVAAAAAFFVSLLSPTPNGLGVREWVIAALTAALSPVSSHAGALASLVDRGVEAILFAVVGGWALVRLGRANAPLAVESA